MSHSVAERHGQLAEIEQVAGGLVITAAVRMVPSGPNPESMPLSHS